MFLSYITLMELPAYYRRQRQMFMKYSSFSLPCTLLSLFSSLSLSLPSICLNVSFCPLGKRIGRA